MIIPTQTDPHAGRFKALIVLLLLAFPALSSAPAFAYFQDLPLVAQSETPFNAPDAYYQNASALGKRVDVHLTGVSLSVALEHIAALGGFRIAFSPDLVSLDDEIAIDLEGVRIGEALQEATKSPGRSPVTIRKPAGNGWTLAHWLAVKGRIH